MAPCHVTTPAFPVAMMMFKILYLSDYRTALFYWALIRAVMHSHAKQDHTESYLTPFSALIMPLLPPD